MTDIINIRARQIINSRGEPTVEVDVELEDGSLGTASVPTGLSTGTYEAASLLDNDKSLYDGKSVGYAINAVNGEIFDCLGGMDARDQVAIDYAMINLDGTSNKSRLGANAILGVSLAVAKAAAQAAGVPLFRYIGGANTRIMPVPMINILNGGMHADNALDFQEFMIMPTGAKSFSEGLRIGIEVFHALKCTLRSASYSVCVGDEGGLAPNIPVAEEALDLIVKAIKTAGYIAGKDVYLAIDCASTSLFRKDGYTYIGEGIVRTSKEHLEYLEKLLTNYPIVSIEDGMAEDDLEGWELLTRHTGKSVQLVGDDIFATNITRFEECAANNIANAVLIKPNQIGSLTETLELARVAHKASYEAIVSHRSGETEDTTVADLAVATGCAQIKAGGVSRSERVAKYNRLLRIEELLEGSSRYAGSSVLKR